MHTHTVTAGATPAQALTVNVQDLQGAVLGQGSPNGGHARRGELVHCTVTALSSHRATHTHTHGAHPRVEVPEGLSCSPAQWRCRALPRHQCRCLRTDAHGHSCTRAPRAGTMGQGPHRTARGSAGRCSCTAPFPEPSHRHSQSRSLWGVRVRARAPTLATKFEFNTHAAGPVQ